MEPEVGIGWRVSSRDGQAGRVSRLLRDSRSHLITHIVVRTRRFFGHDLIVPVEWTTRISRDSIYFDVEREELDRLQVYRTDEEIAGDLEEALTFDYSREDVRFLVEDSTRHLTLTADEPVAA